MARDLQNKGGSNRCETGWQMTAAERMRQAYAERKRLGICASHGCKKRVRGTGSVRCVECNGEIARLHRIFRNGASKSTEGSK